MDSARIVQRRVVLPLASFLAVLSFFLTQQKAVAQESAAGERIAANCRITLPADGEFVPPSAISVGWTPVMGDRFWFGTEKLWTLLPRDGTWRGPIMSASPGDLANFAYSDKFPWFRFHPGFLLKDGGLTVTGKRLDGPASSFVEGIHGGGVRQDVPIIYGGIDIPTFGCWEITGHYKDQELTFTVWVARKLEQDWPSTPDAPPPQEVAPRRIHVDGATQAESLAYHTTPELPPAAKAAGISGTVVLHAIIWHGSPRELQYVSGPPLLVQAAMDAVKWWRYRIEDLDTIDAEIDTTIDVLFSPSHD